MSCTGHCAQGRIKCPTPYDCAAPEVIKRTEHDLGVKQDGLKWLDKEVVEEAIDRNSRITPAEVVTSPLCMLSLLTGMGIAFAIVWVCIQLGRSA